MSEMRPCSATDRQIGSDWVWKWSRSTEVFWKKKCNSYQFRADQTYGHRPQYTADNDAAETGVCAVRWSILSHTPFGARLDRHLFRRTNSEPHKCVYCSHIDINMERITCAELAGIHLVYGAAYDNGTQDLSRAFSEQCVSRLSHYCSEVGKIFEEHFPPPWPPLPSYALIRNNIRVNAPEVLRPVAFPTSFCMWCPSVIFRRKFTSLQEKRHLPTPLYSRRTSPLTTRDIN